MKDKFGDMFTTQAKIIGHGVNTHGRMGAGIAVSFRNRFPGNYAAYKGHCDTGYLQPGMTYAHEEDGFLIMNFASQNRPGADASYPWLFSSLYNGANKLGNPNYEKYGRTIAIPEIGCGIGGLDWKRASKVIQTVEYALHNEVEFEVWHYVGS